MARSTPYLQRRGDCFYFRMFVPRPLRPTLRVREITRTLGTTDRTTAAISALRLAAIAKEFLKNIGYMSDSSDDPTQPAFIKDLEKERADLVERLKSLLTEGVRLGQSSDRFRKVGAAVVEEIARLRASLPAMTPSELEAKSPAIIARLHRLDAFVDRMMKPMTNHRDREYGLEMQCADLLHGAERLALSELHSNVLRERNEMFDAKLKHVVEFSTLQIKAASGASTPLAEPSVNKPSHRLNEALPIWQRLKSPAPSTVEIYTAAVRRFETKHPTSKVLDIERRHIRDYIEWLQKAGLSAKSIEKEHGALRALLTIAVHEEWIDSNPAAGVVLPAAKAKTRVRGYTIDEVRRILGSPVFRDGVRPRAGKGDAAYWVPLLLLFTGARREEICQLTIRDVRAKEGIAYVSINPRDDEGRVKTDESKRTVPLHDRLIQLGFLDFVSEVRKRRGDFLFDKLRPNKREQRGAKWGDWWGRYVRHIVGILAEDISPAHSFRHFFITLCRATNMREDYEWAIAGHSRKGDRRDAHDGYGEHQLKALHEALHRLEFGPLNFTGTQAPTTGPPTL